MKRLTMVLLVFASIVLFNSCGDEDVVNNNNGPNISGGFRLYILNEGSSAGTGTLSLYTSQNDSMYQSIYNGQLTYPDGLYLHGSGVLVLEQGPTFGGNGKLYRLDENGNLMNASQPFGSSPYSLVSSNNKIYVTNGPGSSVSVLDQNSLSVIRTIPVGVYPQEILEWGHRIYVCNTSVFQGTPDSTVSVISDSTDSVIATITLRRDPTSIFIKSGMIYIGCNSAGMIFKIDPRTNMKVDSFSIAAGFDKSITYSGTSNCINFIDGANNISQLDITSGAVTTVITNPDPVNNFFYGYEYINKHYVLDAKSFTVNGKMHVYNNSGVFEKSFTTGIAPRKTAVIMIAMIP